MIDLATSLRRWGRLGLGLFALVLVTTGCDAFIDQDLDDSNPETPSIPQIVTEVQALERLEEGVTKAGLVDDLSQDGPFTVLTPTNDAFAPIAEGELTQNALLKQVLRGHVIAEEIESLDGTETQTYETLAGDEVTLTSNEDGAIVGANNASVTNANVTATNGVVHVVDDVRADAVDRILITAEYRILGELVQQEGLGDALRADGLTVFSPSNDAFLTLDNDDDGDLEGELQSINVSETLQGHVHNGVFSAAAFLDDPEFSDGDSEVKDTTLTALAGPDIRIETDAEGDSVFVNPNDENAAVTVPDVDTDNGVIHGIDAVLTP
ncbi:fasciclin domain-containing protein [Salinibacter ruber]|nr:fasciclin domain-containing protein [Salinibacter ruber]